MEDVIDRKPMPMSQDETNLLAVIVRNWVAIADKFIVLHSMK